MRRTSWILALLVAAASTVARAGAEVATGLGGVSAKEAQPLGGHPVLSFLAHVVFLTVILGMGASAVAVLFKPPFET